MRGQRLALYLLRDGAYTARPEEASYRQIASELALNKLLPALLGAMTQPFAQERSAMIGSTLEACTAG